MWRWGEPWRRLDAGRRAATLNKCGAECGIYVHSISKERVNNRVGGCVVAQLSAINSLLGGERPERDSTALVAKKPQDDGGQPASQVNIERRCRGGGHTIRYINEHSKIRLLVSILLLLFKQLQLARGPTISLKFVREPIAIFG